MPPQPLASGGGLSPRNLMMVKGTRAALRLGAAHYCLKVRRGPGTATMSNTTGHIY